MIEPENPTTTALAKANRRRSDLDALRGFAMLLGIGLHTALSFFPSAWWVRDRTADFGGLFDEFLWAVHGFRMPVFFLMSGFFTALLWRRRGLPALLRHRLRRVGLPLLIGMITIVPLTGLVGSWATRSASSPQAADDDVFAHVFLGDVHAVEEMLIEGIDVNLRSEPGGWTLLHAAALVGDTEMMELLLSNGAEPAPVAAASEGETPLGVAFHYGNEEAADLLVAYRGGDPLPDGVVWSDIPGWGDGAADIDETDEPAIGSDVMDLVARFHHLWFLWFLLWLVAGFALVALIVDRRPPRGGGPGAVQSGLRMRPATPGRIMWSMVPLTLVPQLFMGRFGTYPVFGPDTSDGFIPVPHILAYYAAFFTFGVLMFRRKGSSGALLSDTIGGRWWLYLPITMLVVFPAGLSFTFDPIWFSWPVASMLQVAYAWGMCFGLIGLFRALLRKERRGVRYLSDSSYWLYLIHLPVVIAAQVIVRDWDLPAEVKFVVICVGVTALLLAGYQLFVRYTPIGTLLNGKKVRSGRPGSDR